MASVNVIPTNRVEYTLEHKDFPSLTITEPDGWKTDDKEYSRVDNYDGIFTKFSNNLTFYRDGRDFLKMIKHVYGANTEVILRKKERHPQTNRWQLAYLGYLDMSTYIFENNSVKIKFNSSGLEDILKSRATEKIEIERLDTMDGDALPELSTVTFLQEGRRIFLYTKFIERETNNYVELSNNTTEINDPRGSTEPVPITLKSKSHDLAIEPLYVARVGDNSSDRSGSGDIDLNFFNVADRSRKLNISIELSFNAKITRLEFARFLGFWCRLAVYQNGFNYDHKENHVLYYTNNGQDITGSTQNVSFNSTLSLNAGDSLALVFDQRMEGINILGDHHMKIMCDQIKCVLKIEEDSFKAPSTAKAVMAHELGQRLTQVITSRDDAFYSEALDRNIEGSENTGALNGYSHGFWIRGFDKLPETEDNRYKAFTTSFKDFVDHNRAVWNLGVGIERIGLRERIRIEDKRFFYQNTTTIHIGYKGDDGKWVYPQVSKVKRYVAKKQYYSSLEIGYTKGWDNEEAMGLDEANTKTTFTTPITKGGLQNTFKQISKYIGGSYPKEFIRRKGISEYPTTDHSNDKEIFVHDLKRGVTKVYEERKWGDDFEQEPTGIFSPETATNLRLSVVNILLRHGWVIASTMIKEVGRYIRYGSSEGNSKMTTKLIGGKPYTENGTGDTTNVIIAEDLERARYMPDWIEFEYKVDTEMIQQIEGSTKIEGRTVPNFYGLVKFRNEENDLETGFLFNLKPNDKGQWKLLKANR